MAMTLGFGASCEREVTDAENGGGAGGTGGTGGAGAVVSCDGSNWTELPGKPCNQPGQVCGASGTSCYPVVQCDGTTWTQHNENCQSVGTGG